MELSFTEEDAKEIVFNTVERHLNAQEFDITTQDRNRPWGGFFVIEEKYAEKFISTFFSELDIKELMIGNKLSPKILIVSPGKRLSWQYHHRRAEIWKLIGGSAGVMTSDTDNETEPAHLAPGDVIRLKQGERHRLVGLEEWGIVAEIWQHTDADHPSDEEDIVRVQDDFGR